MSMADDNNDIEMVEIDQDQGRGLNDQVDDILKDVTDDGLVTPVQMLEHEEVLDASRNIVLKPKVLELTEEERKEFA